MKKNWSPFMLPAITILALIGFSNADATQFQAGDTARYFCERGIFQFGVGAGTDCWGYRTPDGTEYAIYGIDIGVAFVNTATMTVVGTVPGPQGDCGTTTAGPMWRDIKSYRHYVYVVSECSGLNGGLMVIDMQYLPDSVHFIGSFPVNGAFGESSHNLSIDTARGFAYLEGIGNASSSIFVHDLADPAHPVHIQTFGTAQSPTGIHDIYAANDTLWIAEGWSSSVCMYDVTDKFTPTLLNRWYIPDGGYAHNIWPSENHQYCVTTEETANKTIKIWDISNLANIQLLGEVLGGSHLAHNAHWMGNKLYVSHYESGIIVVDVTDPTNPFIDLTYDTWPTETPNFNGCWGAYPFTNNGLVYASNDDGRLFILAEQTRILNDTLSIISTGVHKGEQMELLVSVTNAHPLHLLEFPIQWESGSPLSFLGTDRTGTRTEGFELFEALDTDTANNRIAIRLTASDTTDVLDLPAGSGPVIKLLFEAPPDAPIGSTEVTFASYTNGQTYDPNFAIDCIDINPASVSGEIEVLCCNGLRGNVDGLGISNILDVNFLVSFLFASGPTPSCIEQADVDGSMSLNILDVNHLVSYLFAGGVAPAQCP